MPLIDNRLRGPVGEVVTDELLERSDSVGAVSIADADEWGLAEFDSEHTVHGLAAVRIDTGHGSETSPRFLFGLPGPEWHVRVYVWVPTLGDPVEDSRLLLRVGGLNFLYRSGGGGNLHIRAQTALSGSLLPFETSGVSKGSAQWVRIEISCDGHDTVARVYEGHDTTDALVYRWDDVATSGAAELGAYAYIHSLILEPGANDDWLEGTPVSDLQNSLLDLGYDLPEFGADGDYGGETTAAVEAFQGDYDLLVDGFAGAETHAAIALQLRLESGDGPPPPLWLSHLAVADDGPPGPADELVLPAEGGLAVSGVAQGEASPLPHAVASLDLAGDAPATKSTSGTAGGAIPAVIAPAATVAERETFTAATGPLALEGLPAEYRTEHRATWPPDIHTEIYLSGEWVDITPDLRVSDGVTITRGRADEAATADPSTCQLTINNRHGRYSPHNPLSPYYGQLGQNTPLRVRLGPLPDDPDEIMVDTFDRTESGGWGTSDSNHTWESQPWASVDDGYARIQALGAPDVEQEVALEDDLPADLDAAFSVSITNTPPGLAAGGTRVALRMRHNDNSYVGFNVMFHTAVGGGVRVSTYIDVSDDGDPVAVTAEGFPISGLDYAAPDRLRVRCQAQGAGLRMRVWGEGETEPGLWHAQTADERVNDAGPISIFHLFDYGDSEVFTQAAPDPHISDLRIAGLHDRPDHVRFSGEIVAWPTRWELSDTDVWVPIDAAGVLRRLGQGDGAARSSIRRVIAPHRPVAYWPMEDGPHSQRAASAVDGVTRLRLSAGVEFAADDSLDSSGPLPTVGVGSYLSAQIQTPDTGAWSAIMLYHLSDIPDLGDGESTIMLTVNNALAQYRLGIVGTGNENVVFNLRIYDSDDNSDLIAQGSGLNVATQDVDFAGGWRMLFMEARSDGPGNLIARYGFAGLDGTAALGSFSADIEPGRVIGFSTQFGSAMQRGQGIIDALEDMGIGHLSIWSEAGMWESLRLDGLAGETAQDRLSRLTVSAGVPIAITGRAGDTMGGESSDDMLTLIEECTDVDMGVPGEDRAQVGLSYRARGDIYNQPARLELDYSDGVISDPVEPTDDDQHITNDIDVSRSGGSAANATQYEGPRGIDRVGLYDSSVTLNTEGDDQLDNQAFWRLHLGTVHELRFPQISLNIANERVRPMLEDVISVDAGDRIMVANPPHWTQAEALDLIVQGYTEYLGAVDWRITWNCTPASPWQVGQYSEPDDGAIYRYDTSNCMILNDVDDDQTSFEVVTEPGSPVWITNEEFPDQLPLEIAMGGERIQVNEITPGVYDDFDRTETDGWGTSPTGHEWINETGSDSSYWVEDGAAYHGAETSLRSSIDSVIDDIVIEASARVEQLVEGPNSGFLSPRLTVRAVDEGNSYSLDLLVRSNQSIAMRISRFINGGWTGLTDNMDTGITHSPDEDLNFRFMAIGDNLVGQFWNGDDDESRMFQVAAVDDTHQSGRAGFRSQVADSNENDSPVTFRYNNFRIINLQRFSVDRSVNGIVKPHSSGEALRLADPARYAL